MTALVYLLAAAPGIVVGLLCIPLMFWWFSWRPWVNSQYPRWRAETPSSSFTEERQRREARLSYFIVHVLFKRGEG